MGTTEWVQYDFEETLRLGRAEVYWFDDTTTGGGCALPESWRVLYRDGDDWKPATVLQADPVQKDRPNVVTFEPVETRALRLEVKLRPDRSAGILEWIIE
jgi:hypothetical protein